MKKGKPKIAILVDLLVPGGIQKAAIEETHYFNKAGYNTQLFCLAKTTYDYQYQDLLKGLSVKYLSDLNPFPFRKTLKLPFFTFLTANHLLNPVFARRYQILRQFDLIISHGTTTCFTALAVKKTFGVPYLAFIWDPMEFILNKIYKNSLGFLYQPAKKFVGKLETIIIKEASLVITPSRVHRHYLQKSYQKRITVIYPGYDFIGKVHKRKPRYILGYTRWQKEKNPDFFLTLAQKVNYPILLAGYWTSEKELQIFKEQVSKNNLNITISEAVTQQNIPKLACEALVWVHPNFEAFGMVGLEMARLGVPIIIPQGSGVSELFQDKIHGFFPDNNQSALIAAVTKIVNHPELVRKIGKNAQETALKYTWKTHSLKLAGIINKFLQK